MNIVRVTKRYAQTVNLGNYQSLRVETEVAGDVGEDETPEEVSDKLLILAQQLTNKDIKKLLDRREEKDNG